MKIYKLEDQDGQIMESVRNLDWKRDIPGGWLTYGPPRQVCAYGDGSLYTDQGKKYGPRYKKTAWAGAIPMSSTTLVTKTDPLPPKLIKKIMPRLRECLSDYGAKVGDHTCTGMWCNYYSQQTDTISAHKDNEDYYERNYKNQPLFVSLTLYEDEDPSKNNLARFQVKKDGKWKDIKLLHLSLMIMSGDVEHRVMKNTAKMVFRKRYNITFRTPITRKISLVKNFRFFSNFGRYYKIPSILYLPDLGDDKYKLLLERYPGIKVLKNKNLSRSELFQMIEKKGYKIKSAPSTTTTMSLYILYKEIINE